MITSQHKNNYVEITLNRPDKRNAIQLKMLRQIAAAVEEAEKDPAIRLIVIRGAGKAFSAGLDLQNMGGVSEEFGDDWMRRPHQLTAAWQSCLNRLAQSPIPSLALLHGYCLGAGLETALACDFRYAAPDTTLSLEETRIGLIPDVGGTTRLLQVIGLPRAKEMILAARRIDSTTAERWGLINQIVPFENFDEVAIQLANDLANSAPLAVAAAKRVISGIANEAHGLHLEQIEQAPLFFTEDLQEGMLAAMERRLPNWKRR